MKPIIGTLFTGGGIGIANLKGKVDFAFGVEYDSKIAEVYRANISDGIIVSKVQDVDPLKLDRVDLLQVSPVCKNFSAAKVNGKESEEELSQADAICRFVGVLQPPFFVLENVRGYVHSRSFKRIIQTLIKCGYWLYCEVQYSFDGLKVIDAPIINSADFGVPQTRERLILRACKDGPVPALPAPVSKWVGWYEAIEDLIPTLPESSFAKWQLERLPRDLLQSILVSNDANGAWRAEINHGDLSQPAMTIKADSSNRYKAILVDNQNAGRLITLPQGNQPAWTITANIGERGMPKAFILDGQPNNNGRLLTVPHGQEPVFTVQASANHRPARAWLELGRTVQMTPRALARFQSIPDWYELPEKNSLACTVIGNGIPSLLGEIVIVQLLGLEKQIAE